MIEKIFYNVFILGTIISAFILPILIFLSKNKYKYLSKNIYKLFLIILLLLFLPINTFNFPDIKAKFETAFATTKSAIYTEPISITSEVLTEISTEPIVIETDNTIKVESNELHEIFKILPYVWLGISIAILVYNLFCYLSFLRKLKLKYIDTSIAEISIDIGLNKIVLCYTSENVLSPMSIGILNTKIILPSNTVIDEGYEAILKHELFHIKNKDIFCKLLLLLLNSIYWFNPIIYNFINQFNEILELNCDENVLNGQNDAYRTHYAELLLNQIEKNRNQKYSFTLNFANRRKNIMNRFSNIIDTSCKKGTIRLATVLTILLVIALVVIISVPTINFATMPEDAQNETNEQNTVNLVAIDELAKKENPIEVEPKLEAVSEPSKATVPEVADAEPALVAEVEPKKETPLEPTLVPKSDTSKSEVSLKVPVREYTMSTGFYGETHKGVDLAALNGTDIYSSADGTVKLSAYDGGYGNRIVIEHSNGLTTSYSQCSELLVNEGDTVKAGQVIAKVGSTGNSTGPHLHFEVTKNGDLVDPETYIKF